MFHESGGRVAALYQATWVRQAEAEAVLVSPMPDAPWMKDIRAAVADDHPEHARRAVQRDLALAQLALRGAAAARAAPRHRSPMFMLPFAPGPRPRPAHLAHAVVALVALERGARADVSGREQGR